MEQDQTGGGAPVSLDNPQDKPKMSASPHLKFEDGNGPMDANSLQVTLLSSYLLYHTMLFDTQ